MTKRVPEKPPVPLKLLADRVGGKVVGEPGLLIRGIAGVHEAEAGEITFLANPKYAPSLKTTRASAAVVSEPPRDMCLSWLVAADPYYAFAQIATFFYEKAHRPSGVSPLSSIGENVRLGAGVSIHPFVRVEDGAVIGDRVTLYPGVYIGGRVEIGEDSILYSNVTIREDIAVGKRVIIHSGAVIGSDGFGFATQAGRHHKIPQIGSVVIGDDVEIGANVTVDRAATGQTVIGRGTKIDNLVQIGHNTKIGEDVLLVAQVGISGSAEIGDRVTLAGQAGVAGHLKIGDDVVIGAKSGVTKDIPSRSFVSGFPPLPHRQWLEAQASFQHLPEFRKRLKQLEEKLTTLEKALKRTRKQRKR